MNFFDDSSNIGKTAGFIAMEDWYKVANKQFDGEPELLKKFHSCAQFAVMSKYENLVNSFLVLTLYILGLFPSHPWEPQKFINISTDDGQTQSQDEYLKYPQ